MRKTGEIHPVVRFAALLFVYLLMSFPFKVMSVIPGFTDIRPVTMLQPIYGIFFGLPGCLAVAIGNLLSDIYDASLRWSSIAGFLANFAGPFIFCLYWTRPDRAGFDLRTGGHLLRQIGLTLFVALLEDAMITPAVALIYPEVNWVVFAVTVLLNNTAFPILLGIPVMILLQEDLGFSPLGPRKKRGRR